MSVSDSCAKCQTPLPSGAAFCPGCGLATPTEIRQETGTPSAPPASDTSEVEFRERLQRALGEAYELRELIGRGGFGVVYAAWDVVLKREVAIKALRFDLFPTESLVGRFVREAESVAKLRHPNVVPIYSIGKAEGFTYFIMPRLVGSTLAEAFEAGGQLSFREAHRIFRELAGALAVAHRAGIIHRDIKPENVFLEDPERRALLMDFGIAKTADVDDAQLTGTGMIVGTPHYMSPEQASGERHLDHRSDIYSLGVVAYQLFAGRTPFKETTSQKVIVERLTTTPEDLAVVNPNVPEEISEGVMRCLERDPDDRWNSIANLISVLDTVEIPADVDDGVTMASGVSSIEPATRREWIGFGIAAAVLMTGFVATYQVHSPRAIDTPVVSEAEAERIGGDYLVAQGAAGAFQGSIGFHRGTATTREFLLTALGFEETTRRAQQDLPISEWHLTWRTPGESERWETRVGSDGGITDFRRPTDEDEPGARLSVQEARAVADSFLVTEGWDPAALEPRMARSQRETLRTDYFFTWQDTSAAIPWTSDDGEVDRAVMELSVDVSGDRVTRYSRNLIAPAGFDTASFPAVMGGLVALIIGGAIVMGFAMALAPKRRRYVRWRPALVTTGLVLGLALLGALNDVPGELHSTSATSAGAFFLDSGVQMLITGIFIGLAVVMLAMGAATLSRDVYPGNTTAYEQLMSGRWQPRIFGPPVLAGYLVGFVMIGLNGLTDALLRPLSATTFEGNQGYLGSVGNWTPILISADSLMAGVILGLVTLFTLALCRHLFKSTVAAVAVPVLLIPLLSLPLIIGGQPDSVGATLAILVLSLATLRFGVLAGIIGFTVFTGTEGMHLMASGQAYYVSSGVISSVLLLIPGVVVAVAYARARPPAPVVSVSHGAAGP